MSSVNRSSIAALFVESSVVLSVGGVLYLLSLLDTILLLTLVIILIGVVPLVRVTLKPGRDALSPVVLLPFAYVLWALGPLTRPVHFSQQVITYYLFLQLVGLLAMRVGLCMATKGKDVLGFRYALVSLRGSAKTLLMLTSISLLLLSAVSLPTYFAAFGGLTGFIKTGYGGQFYLTVRENVILGSGFEWWFMGAVILVFYGINRSAKLSLFCGIALFAFVAGIILLTGRRHQLIFPLIFGLVLFHYGHRRFPSPVITVGMILGISAAQYYALARYFLPEGLIYALSKIWYFVLNNPYILAPWAANEFAVPAASLLEVLEYGGPGLLLGRSYIAALGASIPFVARLFSKLGFDINEWRLSTFYPDILEAGRGLGFSPVTEGYINFGVIGVILHLFVHGYIIGEIYRRLLAKPSLSALLLFAGSLPVFMLYGFRVPSASFVWSWIRIYLMPWIIFIVLKACVQMQPKQSHNLAKDKQP